ncbi:alginate lyase family protein [Sunxiuqinia indica]|uniref:alginate lyase family protein n=1 Tax=Sunxiuqinia indica TaxID=2692584 RepID=UPI00191560E4|nr:alginate lyase family protein [Sunxiuqinia indica]
MRMRKLEILWVIIVMVCLFVGCGSDNEPITNGNDDDNNNEEPTAPQKIETDPNKTFIHPGLLHSAEDFDRMKAKVQAGAEPWFSGWEKLTANNHSASSYTPQPVKKLVRGGGSREEPDPDNYAKAFNDAAAAYQTAIRWKISGDDSYAETAIKILNGWASTCDKLSGNSNIQLAAGLYGYQFANAAEIMRDYEGWETADFAAFKQWLLDLFYPVSSDFLVRHNNTCISHYWANWDLCNIANVMAIGVLTDNAAIYNEAISYLMEGEGNGALDNAIYYVHGDALAQLQESGRDQGHTLLCIGLLGTIAQMAYNQGDDLFGYDDNKILKAAEYVAKYNYANLNVPFEPYDNCDNVNHTVISDGGIGGKRPVWELLYNHYTKKKDISFPYLEMAAKVHRPEGGGGDYGPNSGGYDQLGFGTLLFTIE